MASIINKVMFNPVNKETLVQKLEKHPRPENFNSLKIKKKCNPEIWSKMLQSTRSKDLRTQKIAGLHFKSSRSNL